MKNEGNRLDPVTFEILRHKLWAINDEQAMTLKRTSCSNVANDIKDMNCALLTAEGDVFALGTYIAMHALTMEFITKDILREYQENPGIRPGDMFICNDPYVGACHENDVAVMKPIGDEVWHFDKIEVILKGRFYFLKRYNRRLTFSYSDYRKYTVKTEERVIAEHPQTFSRK